jgi:hypothetical protein
MKKLSVLLILIICAISIQGELNAQNDLFNKGKSLLKKKDNNQNQNQNQNNNSSQNQNSQQSGFSSDDCVFYAKQFEKHIDAMDYNFENGSDYSGSKTLALEDLDNLKKKCKPADYETLEKKYNNLIAKIEGSEKPAKDKDALWAEHEQFMQQFRADLYGYYNEIFKAEYARSNSERLLGIAKKVNYSARSSHADSICNVIWKPEDLNKGTIWSNFVWIAKTFWELYPDKLKKEIEPAIQECIVNANKEKNPGGKMVVGKNWAMAAINYSRAIQLVKRSSYMEGVTLGEKYEKEALVIYNEFKSKIEAKFHTSKLHTECAQKIIFSKKPISIKAENPSAFTNEFSAGDNIYAMGYYDTDLASFCSPEVVFNVSIFIDTDPDFGGQGHFGVNYPIKANISKNSYSSVELFPAFAPDNQDGCLLMMRDFNRQMNPGKHNIMVKITNAYGDILAKGYFKLDCNADGLSKWNQMVLPFEEREIENARMPKAVQSNPALEAQMKNVLKDNYPGETPLRVVILDNQWTIEKNALTGKPDYKWISTAVAQKKADGKCFVYWISFKQNYENGKYGELLEKGIGDNMQIKIENVNK